MTMTKVYAKLEPARSEIDALAGPAIVEFGAAWCGHCNAAQPLLAAALADHSVIHIKIEDGKGRLLGRSFRVTLWPTLIFFKDGKEVSRLVRPENGTLIKDALAQIDCDGTTRFDTHLNRD